MDRMNKRIKAPICLIVLVLIVSLCSSIIVLGVEGEDTENQYGDILGDPIADDTTEEKEPQEESSTPDTTESKADNTTTTTKTTTVSTTKPANTTTKASTSNDEPKTQNTTSTEKKKTEVQNTRKVFSPKASYAVTFNTNGGTEIKQQILNDGDKIAKPENPTRNGFAFEGWFKDAKFTEAVDFEKDRIKGNVTVFAKWKSLAGTVTHKIIFKGSTEGGGYITASPGEAVGGETIFLTAYPDKGKVIKADTLTIDGAKTNELSFKMPEKDVVIYAEFEDAPIINEPSRAVSKKLIAVGVIVILLSVSLITALSVLRQRNGIEGDPVWVDDTIVISAYGDKKNKDLDDLNNENTEEKNTDKDE